MAELIIEAGRAEQQYWRDLWRYRELFYVLAWRDISIRYRQTVAGILWAIIPPLINSVVLTLVFGRVANMPSVNGVPYFLMVFAAQMPWQFFVNSINGASQSVVGNAQLISKVYFPRMIVPAGAVVTALADLAVMFVLLAVIMAWLHFWPTWRLLCLPFFVLLGFGAALGPGLLLAALSVRYRDVRFITPFIPTLGFALSPVGYSVSQVPEKWRMLYSINPLVGVIDGFRWCLLGGQSVIYQPGLLISIGVVFTFLVLGIRYFRYMERSFADEI